MHRKANPLFNVLKIHSHYSVANSGFTIVELLVVIVVIGILAAITIVSYSGITNRATIASIQSDLTSASTLLKMDQITTESFPTTLALANSGKGITSSQTMDSVIYIPDNTSNPKTFCLQYKKGTNTYAVDSTSSVSSGVCLQNLVTNGDFSNGMTGWDVTGAAGSVTSNLLSLEANGTSIIPFILASFPSRTFQNKKIYGRAMVRVTNTSCLSLSFYLLTPNSRPFMVINNPTSNQWYLMSGLAPQINENNGQHLIILARYADNATANGKVMQAQNVLAIDLTAAFGAGNEPTKAQMDTTMTNYPNNWFNIVAKASL